LAIIAITGTFLSISAFAGELSRKKFEVEYPTSQYYLGIGESRSTGSDIRDYRVAEVLARRDIAQQVRVEITSVDLDFACGGPVGKAYGDNKGACRDDFVSIIQSATSEFLAGSRVVDKGADGDHVYVVVAMPRSDMAGEAREARDEAIEEARESVKEAKTGEKDAPAEAREALLKAKAYDRQARAIEEVKENAEELFRELEAELDKM